MKPGFWHTLYKHRDIHTHILYIRNAQSVSQHFPPKNAHMVLSHPRVFGNKYNFESWCFAFHHVSSFLHCECIFKNAKSGIGKKRLMGNKEGAPEHIVYHIGNSRFCCISG